MNYPGPVRIPEGTMTSNSLEGRRRIWIDSTTKIPQYFVDNPRAEKAIVREIDRHGFGWRVYFVAATGFFTDSYALFGTNVILPALGYIYWPEVKDGSPELIINCATLAGSLVGQLVFGFLADKYGRRRLYGVELVLVIFSTLGMAQASTGTHNSMKILPLVVFWRFVLGGGIGAEYPLSAVITAEFAPVKSRARMMAAVFLMQPLGQFCAAGVAWAVLATLGRSRGLDLLPVDRQSLTSEQLIQVTSTIDTIWRCVIGVGAAPALVAMIFRFSIPESPRYVLKVTRRGYQAFYDIQRYHSVKIDESISMRKISKLGGAIIGESSSGPPDYFSYDKLKRFFWDEGNVYYLLSTAFCWFLLDFAFFGLGINSPRLLAAIWATSNPNSTSSEDWQNPFDPSTNIYYELFDNSRQYIITISLGSISGSVFLIFFIDKFRRDRWLVGSFLALSLFFAIIAATLSVVEFQPTHPLTIVLYVICMFLFNAGPNSLTFIFPAEIFPTQYRCTCHGISAAMGKLGSIVVQLILKGSVLTSSPTSLSNVMGVFAGLMALGAFFAWAWLPNVQDQPVGIPRATTLPTIPSKPLETLANGYEYAVISEGQIIGARLKILAIWTRLFGSRWRGVADSGYDRHFT